MSSAESSAELLSRYRQVRAVSLAMIRGWSAEDMALQSMPDASPAKWHLAHTSWFFEALVLRVADPGYVARDERYFYLFNSYYETLGTRHPRPQRGLLSRPDLAEVLAYRAHVDAAMAGLLRAASPELVAKLSDTIVLGLQHEMQHQELMVTDLLHAFSLNPLRPALWPELAMAPIRPATCDGRDDPPRTLGWLSHGGGKVEIGHAGPGFAFDNETPRHTLWLQPFQIADRPVSCDDYLDFIRHGGYRRPDCWLSEAWATIQREGWQAPAYWVPRDIGEFDVFGPAGLTRLDPAAPVSQLSYFEADAYARWAGARLPTEFEWEAAAATSVSVPGAPLGDLATQLLAGQSAGLPGAGQVWEWTGSAYLPYPGFKPWAGAAGEYNGKFMLNQMVLRGGSWATPAAQQRTGYRNFFAPAARWQFSGLRLARDAE